MTDESGFLALFQNKVPYWLVIPQSISFLEGPTKHGNFRLKYREEFELL